jgi:hypothetical protein
MKAATLACLLAFAVSAGAQDVPQPDEFVNVPSWGGGRFAIEAKVGGAHEDAIAGAGWQVGR